MIHPERANVPKSELREMIAKVRSLTNNPCAAPLIEDEVTVFGGTRGASDGAGTRSDIVRGERVELGRGDTADGAAHTHAL